MGKRVNLRHRRRRGTVVRARAICSGLDRSTGQIDLRRYGGRGHLLVRSRITNRSQTLLKCLQSSAAGAGRIAYIAGARGGFDRRFRRGLGLFDGRLWGCFWLIVCRRRIGRRFRLELHIRSIHRRFGRVRLPAAGGGSTACRRTPSDALHFARSTEGTVLSLRCRRAQQHAGEQESQFGDNRRIAIHPHWEPKFDPSFRVYRPEKQSRLKKIDRLSKDFRLVKLRGRLNMTRHASTAAWK